MMTRAVFAVDVGGVLADVQHEGEPRPYSKIGLAALQERFEVWVVSMCGKARAAHTKDWLDHNGFKIPRDRQIYIPFSEGNKNRVLLEIGAAYFVDDRLKHILPALAAASTLKTVFHMNPLKIPAPPPRYVHLSRWEDLVDYMDRNLPPLTIPKLRRTP